jgi:hypothetical protein
MGPVTMSFDHREKSDRRTRALLRATSLLGLCIVSCSAPRYSSGGFRCAPGAASCPSGFHCAADDRCWLDGSGPDLQSGAGVSDLAVVDLARSAAGDLASASADMASPPSLCAAGGFRFCDGFESGMVDSASWSPRGGGATVDSAHVYRGRFAMHAHLDALAAGAPEAEANLLTSKGAAVTGTIYARVFVYFASPLSVEFDQFLNLADNNGTGVAVALDTDNPVDNNYTIGGQPNSYAQSSRTVAADHWQCVRLAISGQAAGGNNVTGNVQVSIDDQDVTDADLTATTVSQETKLFLGFDFGPPKNAVPAQDAWFDEIVIDDKPITCQQ